MLTIKNIKQIELTFCHSRGLKRVTEITNNMGEPFYSFHFGPISDGIGWNKETEVRLKRTMERNDRYEIFVMGLQSVSRHSIVPKDINSKEGLVSEISKTLARAEHWWKTKQLNNMLTIKNIEKLYKLNVTNWKIGKVVTLDSSYLMQLYKYNSMETKQVNIERTPIGEGDTALYELWFWEDNSGGAKPIRRLLRKCDFELGPLYVIKNIENMMTLK